MTEKLINYNIAKLAKQKGFNGKSNYYYAKSKTKVHYGIYNQLHSFKDISATTQSSLQKWLREKHNIFVYIEPTSLGDNAPFIKDSWGKILYDPWKNNNKGISYTYEDALEFALLEALKLIKDE